MICNENDNNFLNIAEREMAEQETKNGITSYLVGVTI